MEKYKAWIEVASKLHRSFSFPSATKPLAYNKALKILNHILALLSGASYLRGDKRIQEQFSSHGVFVYRESKLFIREKIAQPTMPIVDPWAILPLTELNSHLGTMTLGISGISWDGSG